MTRTLIPAMTILCFVASFLISRNITIPKPVVDKQSEAINIRGDLLKVLSVGMKRLISDIIWIQTLMESDLDHYKQKNLNSWMYLRFKTIATLDPKFYENYYYGGQYLMVVKDDLIGAKSIFHLGLEQYQDDTQLNWLTGYLFAVEQNDPQGAVKYFERIRFKPDRPNMFDTMYVKISSNLFGLEDTLNVAKETLARQPDDSAIKPRLKQQIYSLQAQIDLQCLNHGGTDCRTIDFENAPYIKLGDGWKAQKPILNLKWKIREKKEGP